MLDEWGYSELVIHPPPLNFFSMFLIPCVIRKSLMKRASEIFSKLMFWVENIIYLMVFFCYEMVLVPFIYFKNCFNILKVANFYNKILIKIIK